MNGKEQKFYWIKLKTDFFNQETIDFLLSQKNGCEYIVLYQMLCLSTANSNGEMCSKVGEMIVPYDVNKIVRDTKYFDFDTVSIALSLFKKLGLIYEEENQILKVANFDEMVGSESANANAQRQKRFRERKKKSVTLGVTKSNGSNVTKNNEEYRDKSIEYRDKNIDIDLNIISSKRNNENNNKNTTTTNNINNNDLFSYIEENLGRLLSPIEIQEIMTWEDNELTRFAIKEAILNGKCTIGYIRGILNNYQKNSIKTVEQALEEKEAYKRRINNEPERIIYEEI